MPRGKTSVARAAPREPLSAELPQELHGEKEASKIYKRLAEELALEGHVCQADWRTVALLARTEARFGRVRKEVDKLASLVTGNERGKGEKLHPLVQEADRLTELLHKLYGSLFLTPRSRSASRLTAESARQTGAPAPDEMDEFIVAGRVGS